MYLLTGRDRIHRGTSAQAARTRRPTCPMLVPQPGGAGLARGSRHRTGAGRPAAAGVSGCGILRCGHRLLPGPFHERRGRIRGRGAQGGCTTLRVAARKAGVRRIIYLGGLAHGGELSPHMRSRAETGNILRSSGVPVIEFQASIVIGSGSASFEMIRALVERLPVMITPRWVNTAAQPIAIEDVIEYLAAAARLPAEGNLTFEIGGRGRHLLRRDHARIRPPAEIAALDRARSVPQFVAVEPLADADHAGLCGHWALPHRKRPAIRVSC